MSYQEISLNKISLNPNNPRKHFKGPKFDELVASIKEKGVLEPVILRPVNGTRFECVAGERRIRAAMRIPENSIQGLMIGTIPAIVRELTDDEAFDIMMVENLQREDLTELEEAESFKIYLDKKGKDSLPDLAQRTGINPSYIRRRIAVLKLPKKILKAWEKDEIKYGHLEQLMRVEDKERLEELYENLTDVFEDIKTVQDLKAEIDGESFELRIGFFDRMKAGCPSCSKNSDVQKNLFNLDTENKKLCCLDPKCFIKKQKDWLGANWPEAKKKLNVPTNSAGYGVPYGDYKSFPTGKTPPSCKECQFFVSILHSDFKVQEQRACVGDKSCFKKTVTDPQKKTESTSPSKSKKSSAPRVAWHGRHFREEFFKKAIPEMFKTENEKVNPDSGSIARVTLFVFLNSNHGLMDGFRKRNKIKKASYQMTSADVWNPIAEMVAPDVLNELKQCCLEALMMADCVDEKGRRAAAEHIGIDLKKEWRITEEYLKLKTINEMLAMGNKLGIFKEKAAQDFLYETLGKKRGKFEDCKKSELIRVFLESGVDLAGKVPEEILAE